MALSLNCNVILPPLNNQVRLNQNSRKDLESVRNVVKTVVGVTSTSSFSSPILSLRKGNWVKLICGASFEDVVDIRNLSLVYTLAGVDCIDCAAEESVVNAVNEGIEAATGILNIDTRPWVMISVNDDQDLHFRKAEFDPEDCPLDCSRPCETICPANAISLHKEKSILEGGVITDRCYGCGRCSPVCPYDKIKLATYVRDADTTAKLLTRVDVDAIEIHTNGRQTAHFKELWDNLGDFSRYLRLVAISLPNVGDSTVISMKTMYSIMEPHLHCFNLWQLDGRPMSGDIGRGATKEAVAFAVRLVAAKDRPPGFLQLAGGTNSHTVEGLKKSGLFKSLAISTENTTDEESTDVPPKSSNALVSGVAYGGYARKIVGRVLSSMQSVHGVVCIEDYPNHLLEALEEALTLVGTVKSYDLSLIK